MSLINDAIKQASQNQKKNPPPTPPLHLRAADESSRRSYTPPAILFAVLLVVLALGGVLVGYALQKKSSGPLVANARHENKSPSQPELPASPVVSSTAPVPADKPVNAPAAEHPSATVSSANTSQVTVTPTNSVETTPTSPVTNVTVAPVEPPKPVGPKLQGIAYNASRPSAIVNNRTVYIGDRVGEFRVTQITLDAVTLVSDAETKVLSLSQ